MVEIGYKLSSEEFPPGDLLEQARRAEAAGFTFALVSDHFHPWTDRQGQSPFVWAVLGALARETRTLRIGTGVTCPSIRIHPGIVAQAAATVAVLMPGRFFLGVGSGENLNEHVFGHRWPPVRVRQRMLEEAVEVIRGLWTGGLQDHEGRYYRVEGARLYTRPETPPPILVAAGGPRAAALAARIGDGLVSSEPDARLAKAFEEAGGRGKPRYTEVTVCWAAEEGRARRTALEVWPIAALTGSLATDLALPRHFEAAARLVDEETIARAVVCGPDRDRHVEALVRAAEAGFDHICVHQVGPDQAGFLQFYQREVLPELARRLDLAPAAAAGRPPAGRPGPARAGGRRRAA